LNGVLRRCLKDGNAGVAFKSTRSMAQIAGQSNLFGGDVPLVAMMRFPDRLVRFEAAFALAAALPQRQFQGQEGVVPLLAEAVAQTGTANAVILTASEDERNRIAGDLKGYGSVGGTSAEAAINESQGMPSVDVII